MPRLIDPGDGAAISLDECVDALADTRIDVRDEDSFASLGPLLARLGRNRTFLADLALAELKQRRRETSSQGYGAQVLLLSPTDGRFALRANFWPARGDAVTRASGEAAFVYGMPHDHNFPFLTYGYLGPGYWSDYYECDAARLNGIPGERAGLRFIERARLEPGQVALYRMRRDVHVQLPPDRFSVSLNILGYDVEQPWLDQYRFDIDRDIVTGTLTVAPSEVLLTLASGVGGNGRDLADHFAARHPCERMRLTATQALAGMAETPEAREEIWRRATASSDRRIVAAARAAFAAKTGPNAI